MVNYDNTTFIFNSEWDDEVFNSFSPLIDKINECKSRLSDYTSDYTDCLSDMEEINIDALKSSITAAMSDS